MNNEGTDQTARMHRLICDFVGCIWHKAGFLMLWLLLSGRLKNGRFSHAVALIEWQAEKHHFFLLTPFCWNSFEK